MRFRLRPEEIGFVERAPVLVRAEVTVPAAPDAVWPAFGDAPTWVEWFTGMDDARWTSPPPHAAGSTRSVRVMGLAADETILAFEPGKRFAFRVDAANLPVLTALVEDVTLEPAGAGTRVVYRQALALRPWLRWLAPPLRRQMQAGLERGLAGLAPWLAKRGS
jgi:uncharacterized protein YndB with AHSA1/START domain